MQPTIPPTLQQAWTRVKQVSVHAWTAASTAAKQGWTRTRERSRKAWTSAHKIAQQGWSLAATFSAQASARVGAVLQRGWISFRDSWTKQDWLAGIKPLPPGMAGNLTAIAIVTGLVLTSLVYGDYYDRQIAAARLLPSGEHPSQNKPSTTPQPEAAPSPAPVPEPAKPSNRMRRPHRRQRPNFPRWAKLRRPVRWRRFRHALVRLRRLGQRRLDGQ